MTTPSQRSTQDSWTETLYQLSNPFSSHCVGSGILPDTHLACPIIWLEGQIYVPSALHCRVGETFTSQTHYPSPNTLPGKIVTACMNIPIVNQTFHLNLINICISRFPPFNCRLPVYGLTNRFWYDNVPGIPLVKESKKPLHPSTIPTAHGHKLLVPQHSVEPRYTGPFVNTHLDKSA